MYQGPLIQDAVRTIGFLKAMVQLIPPPSHCGFRVDLLAAFWMYEAMFWI